MLRLWALYIESTQTIIFIMTILCSIKPDISLLVSSSTVKEKNNRRLEESAIGAKVNILQQTCYLFCDQNICTNLQTTFCTFLLTRLLLVNTETTIQFNQAIIEDNRNLFIIMNLLEAASTVLIIYLTNAVNIRLTVCRWKNAQSLFFLFVYSFSWGVPSGN